MQQQRAPGAAMCVRRVCKVPTIRHQSPAGTHPPPAHPLTLHELCDHKQAGGVQAGAIVLQAQGSQSSGSKAGAACTKCGRGCSHCSGRPPKRAAPVQKQTAAAVTRSRHSPWPTCTMFLWRRVASTSTSRWKDARSASAGTGRAGGRYQMGGGVKRHKPSHGSGAAVQRQRCSGAAAAVQLLHCGLLCRRGLVGCCLCCQPRPA